MVVLCMGDYETDEYIKEIIAKYGRASVQQIQNDLGRYYYIRYTNKRIRSHCESMARYGELKQTVSESIKGNRRFLFELASD